MSVKIGARVWTAWKAQVGEFPDEPTITLLLTSDGDPATAAGLMRDVLAEVEAAYTCEHADDRDEPPFVGEWSCVASAAGVLV